MANSFANCQLIAREALPILKDKRVMPNLAYQDYSSDFANVGDTIQVKKPAKFEAKQFDATAGTQIQDITETTVPVKLDKLVSVDVEIGSIENATNIQDLQRQVLEPAMASIAEKVNKDGLALATECTGSQVIGTAGAIPTGLDAFGNVKLALDKAKAPVEDRYAIWSPEASVNLLKTPNIVRVNESNEISALREGEIGRIFGIDNFDSQGIATTGNATKGEKNVATTHNLAFQKRGIAYVTRQLQAPEGQESYTANYENLTLRVVRGYDMKYKKHIMSIDILYGWKICYPELVFDYQG